MYQVVLKLGWAVLRRNLQKQVAAPFWSLSLQDWWRLSLWLLISVGLSGCTHWIQSFVTIFAVLQIISCLHSFLQRNGTRLGSSVPNVFNVLLQTLSKRCTGLRSGPSQHQHVQLHLHIQKCVLCLCLSIYLACIKLISWLQSGAGLAQVVWAATLFNLHAF